MSTGLIPALFTRLVDDAAVFPPGSAPLPEAIIGHREHRAGWYAELVGALLLPSSALPDAARLLEAGERVEVAVAKRGEDPEPGLRRLLTLLGERSSLTGYAEIPLTWGLLAALDTVAEARAGGVDVAAKFRTGGLAAELFPTPVELAAVICACRDRKLPFKLTAGLHHAIRHTDPETGFVHHGFLNVLVGAAAADDGAEVADVAELLAATDPVPLIEPARALRERPRPLWIGFGSCSVVEPLTDLIRLGLVNGGFS